MSREIPYHAKDCEFKYLTSPLASVSTAATLENQASAGTAFTGSIKDVSITPPTGEVEQENFLGEDSNGFQHSRFNKSAFAAAEISGTLVVEDFEMFEELFGGDGVETTADAIDESRYQYGNNSRKVGAIFAKLDNGSKYKSILMNGFYLTSTGDISITDADGHWEMEFEGMCLPADYHEGIGEVAAE